MPTAAKKGTLYQMERELRPTTKAEKKRVRSDFPDDCFLVPKKKKYELCDKRTGKFDCELLRTSYMHAKYWSKVKV